MHRGWTLLLCGCLLVLSPANYALELFSTLPSIGMRGWPAAVELAVHGAVALLGVTGGWMLLVRAPAAPATAAAAVIASTTTAVQSLFWTALPRNIAPGEAVPLTALTLAMGLFWLVMIRRSSAFRRKEQDSSARSFR